MKIPIFTLCDYAQSNGGKLNIIGTFNRIIAEKFPLKYSPVLYVVARVTSVEPCEGVFEFTVRNPDGIIIMKPLKGGFKIEDPQHNNQEKAFDFTLAINNQVFEQPGTYTFGFRIGDVEATQVLYLEQKPPELKKL